MAGDNLINDILMCKDLFVVLSNSNGNYDYLESYRLTNVVTFDNKFWGKFSNVHSACGHSEIYQNQVLSYAYNNFSNVVCTCGIATKTKRFFSSEIYSMMEFNIKGRYRKIWCKEEGGNIDELLQAVKSSKRLKLKIESQENYTYILPLHTVEVDKTANVFYAETEYDGYPEELRRPEHIVDIEGMFDRAMKSSDINSPSTGYYENSEYFLTSFKVYKERIIHRYFDSDNKVKERPFHSNKVSIWEEI